MAQSISWITVSVTLKPSQAANTTGADSIGGSQKSSVSAEIRASSVSTIDTPSVTTTIAFGELPASGASTCRARMWPISRAYRNATTMPKATVAGKVSHSTW